MDHHFAPPAKGVHELQRADVVLQVLGPHRERDRVAPARANHWEETDLVFDPGVDDSLHDEAGSAEEVPAYIHLSAGWASQPLKLAGRGLA